MRYSLHDAILWICLIAWVLGAIILAFAAYKVPDDVSSLREEMRARALSEQKALTLGKI